jgi:hypothetical protein
MAEGATDMASCIAVISAASEAGIEIASTQMLRTFNGQSGFTLAQGQ